jgi:hypothetical protein
VSDWFVWGVRVGAGVVGFFLALALAVVLAYGLFMAVAFPVIAIREELERRKRRNKRPTR